MVCILSYWLLTSEDKTTDQLKTRWFAFYLIGYELEKTEQLINLKPDG